MKRNSYNLNRNVLLAMLALIGSAAYSVDDVTAQAVVAGQTSKTPDKPPVEKYGVWQREDGDSRNGILRMRLRVYPKAAPRPAFRHRLVPAAKERIDGNAALFYLKAMGFFEQRNAREHLTKLERKWRDDATEEQRDTNDYPPHSWSDAAPESLPMEQVEEYLSLLSFQPEFLYDAARRTRYEHDRAIEREPNPIGYLLPSIQQHRELARVQNVRCRFAIAEGRIDDAVEIVGQMMTLGRHLGQDEFFVCSLVGASVHRIGVETGLTLSQQPDTPNLYWAIAACPDPVIDLSRAFQHERELLLLQMPMLREVTEEPRPPRFWADFTRRFTKVLNEYTETTAQWSNKKSSELDDLQVATAIAKSYPTAREFLSQYVGLPDQQLDEFCKSQTVFLAIVKYYAFAQDEAMKQFVVPYALRPKGDESELVKKWGSRLNPNAVGPDDVSKSLLSVAGMLLPATEQILAAAARTEQHQRLWQTVEALRMAAAENDGKFPKSLEELPVPAPLDPATNQPFEYELNGTAATLRAAKINTYEYQIDVELANQNQQEDAE